MGSIFGYKTEVVMRIAIAELLVFAYNLEYLLRLTKLNYTHTFIVDFHGSRIYQMKEKIVFFIVMYYIFAVLKKTKTLMLKDPTVKWLIEKINNPLRGKEPFLVINGL